MDQKRKLNWANTLFLTVLPVLSTVWVIFYILSNSVKAIDITLLIVMFVWTGISITAGYHRCFSHRAYDCNPLIQFFYLCFGAAAFQNSALNWCADHRKHHRHVDRDADPYNINKGFFWAHMGWIFFENPPTVNRLENVDDLKKNRLIMWQHKYYLPLSFLVGMVLPMLVGLAFHRPMGGLLWGGFIRAVLTHHSTFLINSAAHVFGRRPYSDAVSARDNWILAFFTFGEGFHNFHHTYPSDYRNGIAWYHYDPTKWLIKSLSWIRLSSNLRKTFRSR